MSFVRLRSIALFKETLVSGYNYTKFQQFRKNILLKQASINIISFKKLDIITSLQKMKRCENQMLSGLKMNSC